MGGMFADGASVIRVVISNRDQRFGVTVVDVSVPWPWQSEKCNATGSPHTDLFPMNNETLQVDIYKGVSPGLLHGFV